MTQWLGTRTGKTALYRILQKRYPSLLKDVEVLQGSTPRARRCSSAWPRASR